MKEKQFRKGVFISYSHRDKQWLEELLIVLKPLVRGEKIEVWDDTQIKPGANWFNEIDRAIAASRVAILLVSPAFLASDFIVDVELPRLIEKSRLEELTIVWIAVRFSSYKQTALKDIQAANDPEHPLDSLPKPMRNKVLVRVGEQIASAIELNAVANVLHIIDEFEPQARAFVEGREMPAQPVTHRVTAEQKQTVIEIKANGNTFEQITAEELELLDKPLRQFIRANEYAIKDLYERWLELKPKCVSRDPDISTDACRESEEIRRLLCAQLNEILDFLESLGKQLQDHYHHVRFICRQSPQ